MHERLNEDQWWEKRVCVKEYCMTLGEWVLIHILYVEPCIHLLKFECYLIIWIFFTVKEQPTHFVWVVGSHCHESSKLILIHPSTYPVPSFGGTLISERKGKEEKGGREHWWVGFRRRGFEGFWRRWTQRGRERRVSRVEEMGLRIISPNEYSCSGVRLRFIATFGWNIVSNSITRSGRSSKY